jgi:crossover junction endodeoxyribonuclease RuvC
LNSKQKYRRLFGVDPGTNVLGFAVIECKGSKFQMLEMGVVHLKSLEDPALKLKKIFERLHSIIDVHVPEEMAIEAPFYGKNAQAMLKLGRAQGVAMAAAITKGIPVTEYSPRKIKQAVTGNGNATKEQVAAMLQQMIKMDLSDHYLDATDALGVAVCHHYQSVGGFRKSSGKNSWSSFIKDNPDRIK